LPASSSARQILGGDSARQLEYEAAADIAHDRCFIGHTLAPGESYEVGPVQVRDGAALATAPDESRAPRLHREAASTGIDDVSAVPVSLEAHLAKDP